MARFRSDPFQWLCTHDIGVWIVQLFEYMVVDHFVVVDCTNKLIVDNAEKQKLVLSEHALRACGGDPAFTLRIKYARELCRCGPIAAQNECVHAHPKSCPNFSRSIDQGQL